jgi:hypothetical protein
LVVLSALVSAVAAYRKKRLDEAERKYPAPSAEGGG